MFMKKKIAVVVYPNFSMQEIGSICGLFRWQYESESVVFSSSMECVNAEEGFLIQPHKTFENFHADEYDCLVLPGCSDFREALRDELLINFLASFQNSEFVIGAICAAPLFLARAHLLDHRLFTDSLYLEMNRDFPFIKEENIRYQPVVEDGPIITAVGSAFNEFAVAMARKLGYTCNDHVYTGVSEHWNEASFIFHLSETDYEEFRNEFQDLL